MQRHVEGWAFEFVGEIRPERGEDGCVRRFFPQSRYENPKQLALNRYGDGPFCRFRVATENHRQGVYLLTAADDAVYIGECEDLERRFGPNGYGTISPRNCYQGGQSTNCKVNHRILTAAEADRSVKLWFMETTDRKAMEADLIRTIEPPWNSQTPGRPG